MWWPPNQKDSPTVIFDSDRAFDKEEWAKTQEFGWMIVLLGFMILVGIWEAINFRLYNLTGILVLMAIAGGIWKLGIIYKLYINGLWILYCLFTLPLAPFIELYLYIKENLRENPE